ncbi:prenylated Rab acceptor protein 1 [Diorhabda carinulata]|uniref:prenylated Rab acceptor protein 1 n=1 Tax=Diorhabda carinulata TaxID=1163345 RepID=UPI0024E08E41|nr:prenylated Rab acceptor protein 1 isoform X1 [Diorhabda sublineata]XP_057670709.1 prenylated Rab acceptor protein 1 [Diorhabda carinulata]XP_057670710.1 prenylated Rab acceptor protein 1 [Diorhabda carinulata]
MTDITIDVSGEMEPSTISRKDGISNFLKIPTQMPDPAEWISHQKQSVRPWLLFIQTSNFKVPLSVPRLGRRIMKNLEYFQANYLFVVLGLIAYFLITSPLILITIAGTMYLGYRLNKRQKEKSLTILGKELTLPQQYLLLALCSLPIYYIVGVHAAMFGVLIASIVIITLHAAFYNIEALALKEEESFEV